MAMGGRCGDYGRGNEGPLDFCVLLEREGKGELRKGFVGEGEISGHGRWKS